MISSLFAWWSITAVAALSIALLMRFNQQLNFGQALYAGLGAYATVAWMRVADHWQIGEFILFAPLVAVAAATGIAAVLMRWLAPHTGMVFAMMTFGLGELMHQCALTWPVFGGESGLSANRTAAGIEIFATDTRVNMLSLICLLVCLAVWQRLEQSTLGFHARLVRDNPMRAAALGLSVMQIRWKIGVVSGAMAGLAGGLAVLQFELTSPEAFSARRSGEWLIAALMLGAHWPGALLGALWLALCAVLLAQYTPWWHGWYALSFIVLLYARIYYQRRHHGRAGS